MSEFDINGTVVLITGAASGLGALAVRAFLDEGAKHVAFLDVAVDLGNKFEKELNAEYGEGRSKFFKCDVTNENELNNAFKVTSEEQGGIDVVINNAGLMNDHKNIYKKMIEINVTALVTGSYKAYELMRKDQGGKGGTVINISSVVGLVSGAAWPIYSATKAAVLQFGRCLGATATYERTGVRVLTICYGATDTPLIENIKTYDEFFNGIDFAQHAREQGFVQKPEFAILGLIESCKKGVSGSVWLVDVNNPATDITDDVVQGYNTMASHLSDAMKQ